HWEPALRQVLPGRVASLDQVDSSRARPGLYLLLTRNGFTDVRKLFDGVHTQQKPMPPGQHDNLLRHALGEGIADFLAELAVGPWAANTDRRRLLRARH
ncbi:MAG TPA: hypothetical protein VGQ29_03085, partial [Gemmatimonadales bacterium]|nr:hypothetical protein [Gemmatimonadales bacterium]